MARIKRVSLKDVANALGVSPSLVSMVLNGRAKEYRISDEIAKKVFATAKQMNYTPNLAAQNLRSGKSRLIGLVVTDISNPFYSAIARIIEDRAKELNYTVLIGSTDENLQNTDKIIKVLQNKGVEGLIVVPCDGSYDVIADLYERDFPTVLLDRYFPSLNLSSSCLDNFKATSLATKHLLDQGFKKIALIAYNTEMYHILDRISGYEYMMKKAGLEQNILVEKVDILNSKPGIMKSLKKMTTDKTVDAVIFLTNMLAINGLYCLKKLQLRIPDDLSVVAFNRNDVFNLLDTTITYIRQPLDQIGVVAIDMLISKIDKNNAVSKIFAEPELIIQESSLKM